VNWFVYSLWAGEGKNLKSILLISPVADLSDPVSPLQDAGMQIYNPFSGCRNQCTMEGMGYSRICLRSLDPTAKERSLLLLNIVIDRLLYFLLFFFKFKNSQMFSFAHIVPST
jgi:hypothetical protein